jgi:phospholipase C
MDPSGASPEVLDESAIDDSGNESHDRNHSQLCELAELDNGLMDHFVTGSGVTTGALDPPCSAPRNFALADDTTMGTYWGYAAQGSLADRYFQPAAGSSSSNDMYLALARFQFLDNADRPNTAGSGCATPVGNGTAIEWSGRTTIADLLIANGLTFGIYADGYAAAVAAAPGCPSISQYPGDCPWDIPDGSPCNFDASDIPFQYYTQFADNPA